MLIAQLCECTKCHWLVYFERLNSLLCIFLFNLKNEEQEKKRKRKTHPSRLFLFQGVWLSKDRQLKTAIQAKYFRCPSLQVEDLQLWEPLTQESWAYLDPKSGSQN